MGNKSLFRTEALHGGQVNWLGTTILIRPISLSLMTSLAVILAGIVIIFLTFGTYTQRRTVYGHLVPSTGLIQIYASQSGVVLQKNVVEGQSVKQGDVLYLLSSEHQSRTQGDTQAAISGQVQVRAQSLSAELIKTKMIQQVEHTALLAKIADLRTETSNLDAQIDEQKRRTVLAEQTTTRYQSLLAQDYISKEQFQQKQEDLLDQRIRLQGLERERITAGLNLNEQLHALSSLSLTQQNQLAQINRTLTSTKQELTESEAKRGLVITASKAGIATAVSADVGQAIDINKPLVSIIPQGSVLQAQLYAPSNAIGFVRPGDIVLLRYQAYPYQKFGHAKGIVLSVSKTALPSSEMTNIPMTSTAVSNQPLYRIVVRLNQQTIQAYGNPQELQAGMLLDADMLQEKRHLYEWVLEPLFSLTGKL